MELLAPAGNMETAVAALSAGADALYLGLGKFNARHRAENFTPESLAKLIAYAHSLGRKIYVTFNTLICESEVPEVMKQLAILADLQPDAVIVQDLGVVYLLRKYFPGLTVHASTQMGIHNSAGIAELARWGVKRVILERQITFKELELMAKNSPLELEIFIHGSLCVSLSGRCLISNFAEDTSGNRGMCRQLCRRNYRCDRGTDAEEAKARLSPKDLNLIGMLPEFAKLKIASLKIEGRLRGPDYVVPVVQAYRRALDALPGRSPEAASALSRTVSRMPSRGFMDGFDNVVAPELPGLFGRLVGVIESVSSQGVTARLSDRIHLGDKLRIVSSYGASMAGFELARLMVRGQNQTAANAKSTAVLPGRFVNVEPGMRLFKIGENGYDYKAQAENLPPARRKLTMDLLLDADGLHITLPEYTEFEFHSESFAPADRCAASEEILRNTFAAGAPEHWQSCVGKVEISGAWFVPQSVLKSLRKELWLALSGVLNKIAARPSAGTLAAERFKSDYRPMADVAEPLQTADKVFVIPGFVSEMDLSKLRQRLQEAYKDGIRRFQTGGIHGINLLRSLPKDIKIEAVWPLPTANSQAVRLLKKIGVQSVMPWAELPQPEVDKLAQYSVLPLLSDRADCPLLVTRCKLPEMTIRDRQMRHFQIRFDKEEKLYKIYTEDSAVEKFRNSPGF